MKHFYRYLPVSDDIRQSGLFVVAGGYTLIPPHTPYPPFQHPSDHHFQWNKGRVLREYQAIYVTRGAGMFESKSTGPRRISAGSMFVLFPGEWHRYGPVQETGWDEYWVAFDGGQAKQITEDCGLSPSRPILQVQVSPALADEFIRITDELRTEQIGYQGIVSSRVAVLMAMAFALSQRSGFEGKEILAVIEEAKRILSETFEQHINIPALADSLHVGYSLFRREFRNYTGLSPAQYHQEIRINHAVNMLTTTTLPISVVAARIGLDPPAYFFRLFKRKIGCTPGQYRAATQGSAGPGDNE
jgi:AraC-like DNA-binding protein